MHLTKRELISDSLLLLTALIWGTGFVVVKNTLDSFPPAAIITIRYAVSALITAVVFRKQLKGLNRKDVLLGLVVGFLLAASFIVQTIGLQYTTAGKNAFLTTVYVLLVPFFSRVLFKEKLHRGDFIAAGLMLAGIGCLSLDSAGGGLNIGDFLTIICGGFFAAHIIAVERCQRQTNAYALIVLQFAFAALFSFLYNRLFERDLPMLFSVGSVGGLLYVSVVSTTIAMSLQNIGQMYAPASHAAILLSLESVFGALFSWLLLGEALTVQMVTGFAVIFCALMVSVKTPHGKNA